MTVKELIEALSKFPLDMRVCANDCEEDYLIDEVYKDTPRWWKDNAEEFVKINGKNPVNVYD